MKVRRYLAALAFVTVTTFQLGTCATDLAFYIAQIAISEITNGLTGAIDTALTSP